MTWQIRFGSERSYNKAWYAVGEKPEKGGRFLSFEKVAGFFKIATHNKRNLVEIYTDLGH